MNESERGVSVLVQTGIARRSVNSKYASMIFFHSECVERPHKHSHDRNSRINGTIERRLMRTVLLFAQFVLSVTVWRRVLLRMCSLTSSGLISI